MDSSWFVTSVLLEVVYKLVDKSQYFVFSALLHSPNGPLDIFINWLYTFLSLSTFFDVFLFGR